MDGFTAYLGDSTNNIVERKEMLQGTQHAIKKGNHFLIRESHSKLILQGLVTGRVMNWKMLTLTQICRTWCSNLPGIKY